MRSRREGVGSSDDMNTVWRERKDKDKKEASVCSPLYYIMSILMSSLLSLIIIFSFLLLLSILLLSLLLSSPLLLYCAYKEGAVA